MAGIQHMGLAMKLIILYIEKWSFPTISGTRPPPCNFFSFTRIDDHRAVLFGGKQHERRTNDVYIFDMTRMVRFRHVVDATTLASYMAILICSTGIN